MNDITLFLSIIFAMVGQWADSWTTDVGLRNKLAEANPVSRWLTNKIGNVGFALLKCIGAAQVLPIGLFVALGNYALSTYVALGIGAIGFLAGILNYRLLKRYKIPFSFLP